MQPAAPPLDVTPEELEALLESVREALGEAGYQKLKAAIRTLGYLAELLRERDITLDGLRELLLSPAEASTEKTRQVLQNAGIETQKQNQEKQNSQASQRSRPGHGRHGVDAYSGAQKVKVQHPSLHPGDRCPECSKGKVYVLEAPGVLVRLVGQAPITGTVYELEKLRCNLCLQVFTAEAPAGVGEEKYDATSASMMALLKYGSGMPFHRLEGLQGKLEIPLPASTQWGIMKETAERIEPALEELIRQAAQGEVLPDPGLYSIDARTRMGSVSSDFTGKSLNRLSQFLVGTHFDYASQTPKRRIYLRMGRGSIEIKQDLPYGPVEKQ